METNVVIVYAVLFPYKVRTTARRMGKGTPLAVHAESARGSAMPGSAKGGKASEAEAEENAAEDVVPPEREDHSADAHEVFLFPTKEEGKQAKNTAPVFCPATKPSRNETSPSKHLAINFKTLNLTSQVF